ncbi:MAG: hypothetical protein DLM71_03040 [Chloroflexi bacterium]|nr:MAG: hypothetical protein DLM71_03040 [Chloroflexota bacterium]
MTRALPSQQRLLHQLRVLDDVHNALSRVRCDDMDLVTLERYARLLQHQERAVLQRLLRLEVVA